MASSCPTRIPVLVVGPEGKRKQREQKAEDKDSGGGVPVHRVYVRRESAVGSTASSVASAACSACVIEVTSSSGDKLEVTYRHATAPADGIPKSWHLALSFLARAKAQAAEVHITLRRECEGGDGFTVGLLAAHALAHNACRKGLKHAVASIQRALREARLHEARGGIHTTSITLADVPNPSRPHPLVMEFAGRAAVLSAWQERHVNRVWSGGAGWGGWGDKEGEKEAEEEGDCSSRFVAYVGDRFAAESQEFIAHAGTSWTQVRF